MSADTKTSDTVGVDVQQITTAYRQALADETERRIVAEAMVASLKAERAELRERVQALTPTYDEQQPGEG